MWHSVSMSQLLKNSGASNITTPGSLYIWTQYCNWPDWKAASLGDTHYQHLPTMKYGQVIVWYQLFPAICKPSTIQFAKFSYSGTLPANQYISYITYISIFDISSTPMKPLESISNSRSWGRHRYLWTPARATWSCGMTGDLCLGSMAGKSWWKMAVMEKPWENHGTSSKQLEIYSWENHVLMMINEGFCIAIWQACEHRYHLRFHALHWDRLKRSMGCRGSLRGARLHLSATNGGQKWEMLGESNMPTCWDSHTHLRSVVLKLFTCTSALYYYKHCSMLRWWGNSKL